MKGDSWLSQVTAEVNSALDRALPPVIPSQGPLSSGLHSAMRYSVFPGGKRLRPALVYAASEAVRGVAPLATGAERRISVNPDSLSRLGANAAAWPAAAVELVHCYSLVHDDMPCMDDDDFRRGAPSCHRAFGEALGLLAGDALLTLAFQVLSDPCFVDLVGADRACACVRELSVAAGALGMAGGQALDILLPPSCGADAEKTMTKMETLKTGKLIQCAVVMGGIIGGLAPGDADLKRTSALARFGRDFGLAFQIRDDLEDAESQDEEAGRLTSVSVWGKDAAAARLGCLAGSARDAATGFGELGDRMLYLVDLVLCNRR